jgi:hypothetical protein
MIGAYLFRIRWTGNSVRSMIWLTALLVALKKAVIQTENCVQKELQPAQFSVKPTEFPVMLAKAGFCVLYSTLIF